MKSYRNHTDEELLRACSTGNRMEPEQAYELRDRFAAAIDRAEAAERKRDALEAMIASLRSTLNDGSHEA